jgi:alkanesulfonate monooxygenase SsuD/methylene tetrahydromethanopterin reductase-like flavin-dependent oxidoreductase (luciferase family)
VRFAVCVSNFGPYADPHESVRLARAAEASGWEGFFMWDHLAFVWNGPSADPWVTLAAVAVETDALTLGTAITPLPRRRPQVVAEQVKTLERLNGGRVVLGAGLGGNEREFTDFGEDFDPHRRAGLLDGGLETVRRLWDGPVWIGGNSGPALRRASRWEGWLPDSLEPGHVAMTADELAAKVELIGRREDGFEVAFNGYSEPGEDVRPYAEAGATWWLENVHGMRFDAAAAVARVTAGPPKS